MVLTLDFTRTLRAYYMIKVTRGKSYTPERAQPYDGVGLGEGDLVRGLDHPAQGIHEYLGHGRECFNVIFR